jgi:hypothetical protein
MKKYFENPSQSYVAPKMDVVEIAAEGVLCSSGAPVGPGWGNWDGGDSFGDDF